MAIFPPLFYISRCCCIPSASLYIHTSMYSQSQWFIFLPNVNVFPPFHVTIVYSTRCQCIPTPLLYSSRYQCIPTPLLYSSICQCIPNPLLYSSRCQCIPASHSDVTLTVLYFVMWLYSHLSVIFPDSAVFPPLYHISRCRCIPTPFISSRH